MALQLVLMRHAKSDWGNAQLSDHDRPLNERGRRSAPLVARHFMQNSLEPKVVLASTAQRVRETLALMQAEWMFEPALFFEESLYLASAQALRARVRELNESWPVAMILGHNPGLTEFANSLAHQSLEMPTAAVIVLESQAKTWSEAIDANAWALRAVWRARELTD